METVNDIYEKYFSEKHMTLPVLANRIHEAEEEILFGKSIKISDLPGAFESVVAISKRLKVFSKDFFDLNILPILTRMDFTPIKIHFAVRRKFREIIKDIVRGDA